MGPEVTDQVDSKPDTERRQEQRRYPDKHVAGAIDWQPRHRAGLRGGAADVDVPVEALWRLDIPSYVSSECPLCAKGILATHPGTTPAPAGVAR